MPLQYVCDRCQQPMLIDHSQVGETLACSRCTTQFTVPGAAPSVTTIVSREPRRKSDSGAHTWLLAGILFCNAIVVISLLAWEVRYQHVRSEMRHALENMRQANDDALRSLRELNH